METTDEKIKQISLTSIAEACGLQRTTVKAILDEIFFQIVIHIA